MKRLNIFIIAAATLIISAAQCKKGEEQFGSNDIYFRCKINGQTYIPNSCANCLSFKLLEDTSLIANGNAGFRAMLFGLNDSSGIHVKSYELINQIGERATYKNSTRTDDFYRTQDFNPGIFSITEIDRNARIIKGIFSFVAYHSFRPNDSIVVTGGAFRVRYTTQ